MSVDAARAVMWLQNNRRPMGELFDEGYLTTSRLQWAAAKAYDPIIKQAAQVLLTLKKQTTATSAPEKTAKAVVPLTVPMSVQQARSMQWPFSPYKGQPMGALVETKQLSLKDLGYAVENARDERVRYAATALMMVRLNQAVNEPESPAGFLKIISGGRSYAESRQFVLTLLQGTVSGALLGALIVILIWDFSSRPADSGRVLSEVNASPYRDAILAGAIVVTVAMVAGAGLLMFLFKKFMDKIDKQIANHRKGQEGEERVVSMMSQSLDGNWYLFRNVLLPGRKRADLDGVLVGPSGVWVVEVKAYTREHRYIGDRWEYRAANAWKHVRSSPTRQARNNAIHLANFLRADGIQQWVNAVVVWANPEARVTVENPEIPVWTLDRLPDELGNIWNGKEIAEATRRQIVDKLTKLCQRQQKSAASE